MLILPADQPVETCLSAGAIINSRQVRWLPVTAPDGYSNSRERPVRTTPTAQLCGAPVCN